MAFIDKISNIDEVLGKAEGRYFGTGYKKVDYVQKAKQLSFEKISEIFEIQYPDNWSTKSKADVLTPHFSTLNSIVLAIKLVSDYLREQLVVDEDTINNAFISKLSVKAGNHLVEDLRHIQAYLALDSEDELLFRGKIADFSVELTIELFDDSKQVKVVSGEDYYFSAFKTANQDIRDIVVPSDNLGLTAKANFQYTTAFSGIESAYLLAQQLPSILDQVIATGELTELLHARLDGVPRAQSKTLIMRKLQFTRRRLPDSKIKDQTLTLEILKTKKIQLTDKLFRMSNMNSRLGNAYLTYSVAQELDKNMGEN